jgi:hypothetical protein
VPPVVAPCSMVLYPCAQTHTPDAFLAPHMCVCVPPPHTHCSRHQQALLQLQAEVQWGWLLIRVPCVGVSTHRGYGVRDGADADALRGHLLTGAEQGVQTSVTHVLRCLPTGMPQAQHYLQRLSRLALEPHPTEECYVRCT